MKKLGFVLLLSVLYSASSAGSYLSCSNVEIVEVLAGPKHGAMIKVSDSSCGHLGYLCLDPESEFMSSSVSERLYSFALATFMSGKNISVTYDTTIKPVGCKSSYPMVFDIRVSK